MLLVVAMRNQDKIKLKNLPEAEQEIILNAIKKTVRFYIAEGWSYGMAAATAANQAKIQKGVILKEIAKDRAMMALRDEQRSSKRFNKRKFLLGVEASADALKAFNELEGK